MKALLIITHAILSLFSEAQCQHHDTTTKHPKLNFLPLPILYHAPETRLVAGAALTTTFRFAKDSLNAKPSQFTIGAAYTQNKQLLFYLPFQVFYQQTNYYFFGELGYYLYNYYYFGIGNHEVPKELYGVNYPRIQLNALKKLFPSIYAGLRYQYENFQLTATQPGGELSNGTIPGSKGSTSSAAGIVALFDSRDTVFYPSQGLFASFSISNNARFLGTTDPFVRYVADIVSYHRFSHRGILALNYYASFISGNPPFSQLSFLGGSKRLRGYYEGRYRDKNAWLLQAESRWTIYKRWGGVVFAGAGATGNANTLIHLQQTHFSYGAGLRFTVNRKDHLNLRLDYGEGTASGGLYFTIGEAF